MSVSHPEESSSRADVGLVYALPIELGEFWSRCEKPRTYTGKDFTFRGGLHHGVRVVGVESGTGQQRAARATRALLEGHQPRWVVSCGLCGALEQSMVRGGIVVANSVCTLGNQELQLDLHMTGDPEKGLYVGRTLTVDHIVRTVVEKLQLAARTRSISVDMESFAVLETCRQMETRCMVVRAVSDDLSADLPPEVLSLLEPTGSMRMGALVGALWNRPSSLSDLWTLREHATLAGKSLAEFLSGVVQQLRNS